MSRAIFVGIRSLIGITQISVQIVDQRWKVNHDSNIYYRIHLRSNSNDDIRVCKRMVNMREKTNCPNCGALMMEDDGK